MAEPNWIHFCDNWLIELTSSMPQLTSETILLVSWRPKLQVREGDRQGPQYMYKPRRGWLEQVGKILSCCCVSWVLKLGIAWIVQLLRCIPFFHLVS